MSVTFSAAAIERIAHVAGAKTEKGSSTALALLAAYAASRRDDDSQRHVERHLAQLVTRFAELLELAVASGYVDLHEVTEQDAIRHALEDLCSDKLLDAPNYDQTLIYELLARLQGEGPQRVETRDDDAFYAFAAYVAIDEVVQRDRAFLRFAFSSNHWRPSDDLGFLLSPRHFTEALLGGSIGKLETPDAGAGLRAIEYLFALHDFEQRVSKVDGLFDKVLRQATWSHEVATIELRLNFWWDRMAEWPGVDLDELIEAKYRRSFVSRDLAARLAALGLLRATPKLQEAPTHSPDQLIAEGRWGAAIAALRDQLSSLARMRRLSIERWNAEEYVDACLRLEGLDQRDEAAAWLSKVEPELTQPDSPIGRSKRELAFAILGAARQGKSTIAEGGAPRDASVARVPDTPVARVADQPVARVAKGLRQFGADWEELKIIPENPFTKDME